MLSKLIFIDPDVYKKKIISDYQKSKNPPTDYLWIQKLTGNTRTVESSPNDAQDGADPVSSSDILHYQG